MAGKVGMEGANGESNRDGGLCFVQHNSTADQLHLCLAQPIHLF